MKEAFVDTKETMRNLIIVLIAMAVLVGGYQYIVSPMLAQLKMQKYRVSIEEKERCQREGQKFYENQKTREDDVFKVAEGDRLYGFNKELNTCIIAWSSLIYLIPNKLTLHYHYVTDTYSNKILYEWSEKSEDEFLHFKDSQGSKEIYENKLQYYGLN